MGRKSPGRCRERALEVQARTGESVDTWRTDIPAQFATALSPEKIMFEAADPEVFTWYVKQFGPDVNVFVDHSQIVQLQCLRSGIWGTKGVWGRVIS